MNLCGININCYHVQDLFLETDKCKILVTVNSEAIVRAQNDRKLYNIINSNYASIDGQIPLWLYKLKYRSQHIDKISGSDLIYNVAEWAEKKNKKIFLLGGSNNSNEASVLRLRQLYPSLQIKGYSPPYSSYPFNNDINNCILDKIAKFAPDYLFVGFGMGKQEYWSHDNLPFLEKNGIELIVGCGGTFDFVSGKFKRAPLIIQNCGLEGVWRLFCEMKWFRVKRLLMSFKIFYYYFFPDKK